MAVRPSLGAAEVQIADVEHAIADRCATAQRDCITLSALCRQRRLLLHLAAALRHPPQPTLTPARRPS